MPELEKALVEETSHGLPVRKGKHREIPEAEVFSPVPKHVATQQQSAEVRKPGQTETVTDPVTGQTYTFTLPDAGTYRRLSGRRFRKIGTDLVFESTEGLRAVLLACVTPKPDYEKMRVADAEWLEMQFQNFLFSDKLLFPAEIDLEKEIVVHEVREFRSPYTNRLYGLFIPSAAEINRIMTEREQRFDRDTGDALVELSAYDALLERYLDPPLNEKTLAGMLPIELEWLEFVCHLFRTYRGRPKEAVQNRGA
jgi:hypothetical protein